MATLLAVAALSARMLAEAARDAGFEPLALDLFGDADTRRSAAGWLPVGEAGRLAIDDEALLTALRRLSEREAVAGWIAGSGFEGRPELLAAGARILPLLGNAPAVVDGARTPARFFGALAALGVPHPETRTVPPPQPEGWLVKDGAGSGGWNVRHADAHRSGYVPGARTYYQRIAPGEPMSALFLADGRGSGRIIGVSRQIVRRLGGRPYVFRGCIGPLLPLPAVQRELERIVDAVTAEMGLRGLNGMDFLLDGERVAVLELNPRPSASMALYRDVLPGGPLRGHLAAVLEARLPAVAELAPPASRQRGFEIVFARRNCRVGAETAAALGRFAWCHDLPAGAFRASWGEPLCTVSAEADTVTEVQALLGRRRREIRSLLEQTNE